MVAWGDMSLFCVAAINCLRRRRDIYRVAHARTATHWRNQAVPCRGTRSAILERHGNLARHSPRPAGQRLDHRQEGRDHDPVGGRKLALDPQRTAVGLRHLGNPVRRGRACWRFFSFSAAVLPSKAALSGQKIERFKNVERCAHWLLANSFILLALTGLNLLYGRYVLKPFIGAEAFATLTELGKYVHNYVGFAFMLALIVIVVLWIKHNFPNKHDLIWLAKGGGHVHQGIAPPGEEIQRRPENPVLARRARRHLDQHERV